ncbi:hypothetical protein NDU88_000931 [Pleurodeles waltl]|uniref:Uncharacterized protein n=1 Tax=Pleurodeles waltl TaxID=8319 RepID=A0AAV7V8X4_PLEWA|nr:hypothetical protein NDU88_000931 [Pleurodeles waltl]
MNLDEIAEGTSEDDILPSSVPAGVQRDPPMHHKPTSMVSDVGWSTANSIPTPPEWQSLPPRAELEHSKRKVVNNQASQTRHASWQDIRIGDQVVIRDRCPGWKFRTPYEPCVWTVTGVSGTMVTVAKGSETVARNVSWCRRATFEDPAEGLVDDDCSLARPVADGEESQYPVVWPVVSDQLPRLSSVTTSLVAQPDGCHSQ